MRYKATICEFPTFYWQNYWARNDIFCVISDCLYRMDKGHVENIDPYPNKESQCTITDIGCCTSTKEVSRTLYDTGELQLIPEKYLDVFNLGVYSNDSEILTTSPVASLEDRYLYGFPVRGKFVCCDLKTGKIVSYIDPKDGIVQECKRVSFVFQNVNEHALCAVESVSFVKDSVGNTAERFCLSCRDPLTLELRWRINLSDYSRQSQTFQSIKNYPILTDEVVIMQFGPGRGYKRNDTEDNARVMLKAISLKDGTEVWRFSPNRGVIYNVFQHDSKLHISCMSEDESKKGRYLQMNPNTGDIEFDVETDKFYAYFPHLDNIIRWDSNYELQVYSADLKELRQTITLPEPYNLVIGPAISGGNSVYIGFAPFNRYERYSFCFLCLYADETAAEAEKAQMEPGFVSAEIIREGPAEDGWYRIRMGQFTKLADVIRYGFIAIRDLAERHGSIASTREDDNPYKPDKGHKGRVIFEVPKGSVTAKEKKELLKQLKNFLKTGYFPGPGGKKNGNYKIEVVEAES